MNIYHYEPSTGIYLGQTVADESPLEPGVFLIPAFATEIEPPNTPEGFIAVFNGSVWSLEEVVEPEPIIEPEPPTPYQPSQSDLRRFAYQEEADALFFKAQRNEISIEAWYEKIEEIRNRFPYEAEEG